MQNSLSTYPDEHLIENIVRLNASLVKISIFHIRTLYQKIDSVQSANPLPAACPQLFRDHVMPLWWMVPIY